MVDFTLLCLIAAGIRRISRQVYLVILDVDRMVTEVAKSPILKPVTLGFLLALMWNMPHLWKQQLRL